MPSYCLKCKKKKKKTNKQKTKTKTQEFQRLVMVKQCYYQNVQYVVVKNQDL